MENKSVSFLNALNKNCSFAMHPVKPFSVLMPLILVCKVNLSLFLVAENLILSPSY